MFPWDKEKLGIPWFIQPTADFITEDIPAAAGRVGEFFVDDIPQAWGEFWQTEEERKARLAAEQRAELQGRVEDRLAAQDQARAWEEDSGGLPTRDITSQGSIAKILGVDREDVPAHLGGTPKEKKKKEMDEWEQAFLLSMMENMRGENIGQAPAVVAGGGQRQWPSMMRQFAPWEQQKPYWWIT